MVFGSSGNGLYDIAGWALGIGILVFLVGIGLLVAGLVRSGAKKPTNLPPT